VKDFGSNRSAQKAHPAGEAYWPEKADANPSVSVCSASSCSSQLLYSGSWLLPQFRFPKGALVKRARNGQQALADQIKKEPRCHEPRDALSDSDGDPATPPRCIGSKLLFQTAGADDAVIMFGNALAAKELMATGAERCCFAQSVVQATLVG
jgi:hypothetical protein